MRWLDPTFRQSRSGATTACASLIALLALGACGADRRVDDDTAGATVHAGAGAAAAGAIVGGTGGAGGTGAGAGGGAPTASQQVDAGAITATPDAGEPEADAPTASTPDANVPAERSPASTFTFEPTTETPGEAPYFVVHRPDDLDVAVAETGGPLPVIVWGNGGCFRFSAAWDELFQRWVTGGFVVLALDVLPDNNPLAAHTADDHGALVDWVIAENEDPASPYAGKLDTARIVSAGNSCGGVTALTVAAADDRVAAVFVLSGSSAIGTTDVSIMGAITAPVGYIEGGPEDISRAAAEMDYAAMTDGVPAMIVARSTGDHLTVSYGDQTIVAREAEMSLHWMDLALYGTRAAYDALTSPTICTNCDPGLWTLTSKHLEALLP